MTRSTPKAPKAITAEGLERSALHYLERYATSARNLTRMLMRRVDRSCRHHGEEPERYAGLVDDLVARYVASGLLDDGRYAQAKAATLRRRGASGRAIAAKLIAKGVPREAVAPALEATEVDDAAAARNLARRKRIGPFRRGERAPFRDKDMQAMARAGFSYEIVRALIDAEDGEMAQDTGRDDAGS